MKKLAVLTAVHTAQLLQGNGSTSGAREQPLQVSNMSVNGSGGGSGGRRFDTDIHGNVNVLLGGAMLGIIILVIVLLCYCCHRNMRKNRPQEYSQYWRGEPEFDHNLEVFTMDSHVMCYERGSMPAGPVEEMGSSGLSVPTRPATPGPPPAYESLIFKHQPSLASPSDKKPQPEHGGLVSPGSGCRILPVPIDPERGQRALKEQESRRDDEGLPSYEAALKLEAQGYV